MAELKLTRLLELRDLKLRQADHDKQRAADEAGRYLVDPAAWVKERLGEHFWSKQREIAESVRDNRYTAVQSCHDAGKCIYHMEMLTLADGRMVQAKDLIGRFFVVPAFLPDGTQRPALAWGTDNGVKPVFRVTTDAGRQIVRTGNHPLFRGTRTAAASGRNPKVKSVGWAAIEELAIDDLVLVPEQLHVHGNRPASEDHVKLLGYLLGDGGTTVNVTFTQKDGPAKTEFAEIVERQGGRVAPAGKYGLRTVGPEGGRFTDGNNPIITLAREWGLFGCKAVDKRFPDWAWELPNDQLALLLNRLFSCDGWAYVRPDQHKGHGSIGMSLASERLLRDVELALLRLGIPGRVRQRNMKLDGKTFPAWEWTTTQAHIIQRFAEVVGIYGKEPALDRCVAWSKTVDLNRVAKWRNAEAPAGYRWEKIKNVEAVGEEPTVTISVEKHHTFVTSFVEHNSFCASRLVAWWLSCHPDGDAFAVTTAPTAAQVSAILWREIRRAHRKGNLAGYTTQGAVPEWKLAGGELIGYGRKPADEDQSAFQGIHALHPLVVVDEAGGVPKNLFDAVDALATNENARVLAIGNPDAPASHFASVCKPGSGWNVIRIDGLQTPNMTADALAELPELADLFAAQGLEPVDEEVPDDLRPLLLSPLWVAERIHRWGIDSPIFTAKVRGQFPDIGDDVLIPPSWILAAQQRAADEAGPAVLGVDVARFGMDRTVIYLRRGTGVSLVGEYSKQATTETTGRVIAAQRDTKADEIRVDGVGVGAGVVDQLTEKGYAVLDMQAGAKARNPEKFANARAEWFWGLRERFETDGIAIDPADDKLAAQLGSIKYKYTPRGQIQIESKDDMKKRGLPSPDRADAVMMTAVAPAGADLFRRIAWRYWQLDGSRISCAGRSWAQNECWIFATSHLPSGDDAEQDFAVVCVWAKTLDNMLVLLDRARWKLTEATAADRVRPLAQRWRPDTVFVARKQRTEPLVADLNRAVNSTPLDVDPDPMARVLPASAMQAAGKVWLPAAAWAGQAASEFLAFPNSRHAGTVECLGQAARVFNTKTAPALESPTVPQRAAPDDPFTGSDVDFMATEF